MINGKSLDLTQLGSLTFKKPDFDRFHALSLAYKAGKIGGMLTSRKKQKKKAEEAKKDDGTV